jgi:hypothetical protein
MSRTQLRRRCAAVVARLRIPTPFDVDDFCGQLGEQRGRPIHRMPMDLPTNSPCGLLVSTQDSDFVVYEQRTTPPHQVHIVLHELAHLLLQHEAQPVVSEDASRLLLPDLDPALVRHLLGRSTYSVLEEREAELVASLIHEQVLPWGPVEETWTVPPDARDVIGCVDRSLRGQPRNEGHGRVG